MRNVLQLKCSSGVAFLALCFQHPHWHLGEYTPIISYFMAFSV
jgi:hypothetical protein